MMIYFLLNRLFLSSVGAYEINPKKNESLDYLKYTATPSGFAAIVCPI